MSVNWKELAPWIPDTAIGIDDSYLLYYSRIGAVLYNTDLVKGGDVPRRLRDLLNPKWRGQIATTPYVFGFREAAGLYARDEEITSFLREFQRSGNVAGFMRCGEDERLASGEFAMLAIGCGTAGVQELKAKGAPVDYAILEDLAIMSFWAVSVPKHSAHPNLAKLFAVYAMTREAQDIQWKYHNQDLHYLEGSKFANELRPKLVNIEPQIVTNDVLVAKFDELDRIRPQLLRAVRGE
jgi:iron(III) transport system substrate-binding protein